MDIKEREREVVQITERKDDTSAGINLVLALVLGALICFLVYLVSATAISTWYPPQNVEYKIERNTTITPAAPTTAPMTETPAQTETTTETTTEVESTSPQSSQ